MLAEARLALRPLPWTRGHARPGAGLAFPAKRHGGLFRYPGGDFAPLCADALGLGSVWLGTWPQMDRVEKQAALFNLPETIVPHSILALGYPAEENKEPRESRYEENRVHFEKW